MNGGLLIAALALFLVVVALGVALLRDVLAATVMFAAYSLGMAVLWLALQAPDVALTEAAVGAGVTTSIFVVAIIKTSRPIGDATAIKQVSPSSVVAAGGVAVTLGVTLPALPAVGDPTAPAFQRLAPYYLENAVSALGIENVVTAILGGYRSLDTFGEVLVVFAAGIAVLVVFRREAD